MKELIGLTAFAYLFAQVSPIPFYMKKLLRWRDNRFSGMVVYKRLYPFDCAYCFAFWLTFSIFAKDGIYDAVLLASISSLTNYCILHVLNSGRPSKA